MIQNDTYKTIRSVSRGVYKEKGSKFIAYALPVMSPDDIKPLIDDYRKMFHDARHHCYAYMLGFERENWRANDDGEPSGTAGKPILGQINSFGLTNILIIVIRYFGGTLLGTSGLIHAYKTAAYGAIKDSEIIDCTIEDYYKIEFPYSAINNVMKILKEGDIRQTDQVFGLDCSMTIGFRISARENIIKKLSDSGTIILTYIETR